MRKKQKIRRNIILLVLSLIVIIYIANISETPGLPFSTIPEIQDTGTSQPSFTCGQDVDYCLVTGNMECDNPTSQQSVIFRTNAYNLDDYDSSSTWVSLNGIPSGNSFLETDELHGYCYTTASSFSQGSKIINTPNGNGVTVRNGNIYIETPEKTARKYEPCGKAELSTTPLQGYETRELNGGNQNTYNCQGNLILPTQQVSLSYSRNQPTTSPVKTNTFQINPGQIATISGGSNSFIEYATYKNKEICSRDFCQDTNNLVKCIGGEPSEQIINCQTEYGIGYICDDGQCKPPLQDINIRVTDFNGKVKEGFLSNEQIKTWVTINSNSYDNYNVKLEVREETVQGEVVYFTSQTLKNGQAKDFIIPGFQYTGEYFILLEITYQGSQTPLIYGDDIEEKNSFFVANQINAQFQEASQELSGIVRTDKAYTGYPIQINYLITDSGNKPTTPDSVDVSYNIDGGQLIKIQPSRIETGNYIYEITLQQAGLLKFFGTATRSGYTTQEDADSIQVIQDEIEIKFTDLPNFVELGSTETIKFQTTNKNKDLIDTNNIVRVREITTWKNLEPSKIIGSNGEYEFTYTFNQRGAYEIEISSQAQGIASPQPINSGLINSGDKPLDECELDSDCGSFFKHCVDGKCQTKTDIIVFIFAIISVVIVIIFLIYRFIKKRKTPQFGDLGGFY